MKGNQEIGKMVGRICCSLSKRIQAEKTSGRERFCDDDLAVCLLLTLRRGRVFTGKVSVGLHTGCSSHATRSDTEEREAVVGTRGVILVDGIERVGGKIAGADGLYIQ